MWTLFRWIPILLYIVGSPTLAAPDRDRVTLQEVPGSPVKQGTAVGTIAAPAEVVWKALTDYEHYTEFMPRMQKTEIHLREPTRVVFYGRVDMPFPVSDVAYVCEVNLPSDHKTIEFRMVPGTGEGVKRFYGDWKLEPVGEATQVTYTLLFETEAGYPAWIVDLGNKYTLGKILQAVRKRVAAIRTP